MNNDISKKIRERSTSVPFGNSVFQIANFIAKDESPERTCRNVLLQADSKVKALAACSFRRKRLEIDLREKGDLLLSSSGFDRERLEVDIEEISFNLQQEEKLIQDCMIELSVYDRILSSFPEFTRSEFESKEREYWTKRFSKNAIEDLRRQGCISKEVQDSLASIDVSTVVEDGKLIIASNSVDDSHLLELLNQEK